MTRYLLKVVACAALMAMPGGSASTGATSTGQSPLTSTMYHAAAAPLPHLSFPCNAPDRGAVVTCRLSGAGFQPRERLHIVYRVDVTAASGMHRRSAYHRTALTDGRGSFTRPAFWFHVDPHQLIYRAMVAVAGARGDHATITVAGTP